MDKSAKKRKIKRESSPGTPLAMEKSASPKRKMKQEVKTPGKPPKKGAPGNKSSTSGPEKRTKKSDEVTKGTRKTDGPKTETSKSEGGGKGKTFGAAGKDGDKKGKAPFQSKEKDGDKRGKAPFQSKEKKWGKDKAKFQKPGPKTHGKKDWKPGQKRKAKDEGAGDEKRQKLEEMKTKDRKQVRKQSKTNFDLAQKAKTAWETIRRHNCTAEVRTKHINELYELLQGKVMDLMKAHDTVRVIQCCVQFGTEEQRAKIFQEAKDHILELSKSKYAKFYVLKMFRYGTKEQRLFMTRAFHGRVCQLIRHKEAAEVLEEAYNNYANATERSALLEEFYGARFAVFKTAGIHSLEDILKEDPSKRETIMEHMLKTLTPLMDKTVVKHTIVHKAIYDFLVNAPDKMRAEFIESMREVVVQILHTNDGARSAMMCLWYGTTKDRKMIIKSFKTFVGKISKEEFGHRALLALFDCVDDTKIVAKVILEEMMKSAYEVATDQFGRKVLIYLLVPRDPSHFHPDVVKQLQKGDGNPVSKKEVSVRRKELLEAASPFLLKLLITHTKEMVYSKSNSQLALAILQHIQGDKSAVYSMLATLAAEDLVPQLINDPDTMDEMHIVEHPAGHLFLKRLLAHEKKEREQGEVSSSVSQSILDELTDENIRSWLRINRGAFVLTSLVECGNEEAKERIRSVLQASKKNLSKLTSKGVTVLREKLAL